MNRNVICAVAATLVLAGCAHDGVDLPPVAPDPIPLVCPASAMAAIEAEPVGPVLTEQQEEDLDVSILTALGPVLGEQVLDNQVFRDVWARRGWSRLADVQKFCRENGRISP